MIQKKLLCVIQLQFLYVAISTYFNIQSRTVTECNRQLARCKDTPRIFIFVSRMFLTHSHIRIFVHPRPPKSVCEYIVEDSIIIRLTGKKYGVMKPSNWMICHGSSSSHVANTYVNNMTNSQNAQRPEE
jgi:hypothetical protein